MTGTTPAMEPNSARPASDDDLAEEVEQVVAEVVDKVGDVVVEHAPGA